MKAGTVLVYPEGFEHQPEACIANGTDDLPRPARLDVPVRRQGPASRWSSTRRSTWRCPPGDALKLDPDETGWVLPENARRLVPGSSWGTFTIACTIPIALFVGWYMYQFPQGEDRRGVDPGRGRRAGRDGRRGVRAGLAAGAVLLAVARRDDLRAGGLRLRRGGAAGLALALPARLSVELPQDRHDLAAGRRRDRGQPEAARRRRSAPTSPRAAGRISTGRSSPMSSFASCAARSRGFTRWSPRARRPRWSTARATSG